MVVKHRRVYVMQNCDGRGYVYVCRKRVWKYPSHSPAYR